MVRITTNLVQIDVVVTDKDGKQVTDLRPDEFEILEDDKRQQITNFSYVSALGQMAAVTGGRPAEGAAATKGPAVPPARLKREQVRRTIALVVDDLGLSFESMGSARQGLRKFVDEQMQPNDLVAILRTSASGGAHNFTSDKRQLYAAIERVRWYPQGRGGLSAAGTFNEPTEGSDMRDVVQAAQEAEESRAGLYSVGTFSTVSSIVRGLGQMPGRKSLVLVSEAFRLFSAQGRNIQVINSMRRLVNDANEASVSIYTVDASGLQTDAFEASDQPAARAYLIDPQLFALTGGDRNAVTPNAPPRTLDRADSLSAQAEKDSGNAFRRLHSMMDQRRVARNETHTVLSYLAEGTGGSFVRNRNDIGAGIGTIMSEQSGYYLIGFRPSDVTPDPATGRPRRHDITVKVKRPGLKWRTRTGYFGLRDEEQKTRPRTRDEQLSAALLSPFSSGDVGVSLTSLFGTEPGGASPYVRSLLHVDARTLTFKEAAGARATELDVILVAFGGDGRVVEQASYPQAVRAADEQEYQRLLRDGLTYIFNLPVKSAGAYQVRAAVRDSSSERVGAAAQFVEVPDLSKQRLVLSGVVVSGVNPAAGAAPESDPQAGPAVRRLRQGTMLDYRYNIYNAKLGADGKPQLQTQMRLFRDGQPVFTGKLLPLDASKQADAKRLAAAGRLRIGPELVPGQYTLQVTVTDALAPEGRRTAEQWSDFEIVN
ncbi:MAG TPA: VWA domain-containing protein [Pyrinomonadaceae bacterium]|nr:VWA domain-containing protein [Pyrinomonadaceae bacterium]